MTREQFQADHRHEIMGLLMDMVRRSINNQQMGLFLDMAYPKIDTILGVVYDAALEKTKTPSAKKENGK